MSLEDWVWMERVGQPPEGCLVSVIAVTALHAKADRAYFQK
jgi:hypothetical protein